MTTNKKHDSAKQKDQLPPVPSYDELLSELLSEDRIANLARSALERPEFEEVVQLYGLDTEPIIESARAATAEIAAAGTAELVAYRDVRYGRHKPERDRHWLWDVDWWFSGALMLAGLLVFAGYGGLLWWLWDDTAGWITTPWAVVAWVLLGLLALAIGGGLIIAGGWELADDIDYQRSRPVHEAESAWEDAVRENGMLPFLRDEINSLLEPSFGLTLPSVGRAPGLRNNDDERFLVTTSSFERFQETLDRYDGGAIGLAGPRGAGKTVLIRGDLLAAHAPPEQAPRLPFVVSAPVRYEARDFVLHLHARLCHAVIEFCDRRRPPSLAAAPWRARGRWRWLAGGLIGANALWAAGFTGWTLLRSPELMSNLLTLAVMLGTAAASGGAAVAVVQLGRRGSRAWDDRDDSLRLLRAEAEKKWGDLRYLQTHTTGWSGKVSVPKVGAELSRSEQRQLAKQPQTLPELVDDFRAHLENVAAELTRLFRSDGATVVIGIDELDKIDSTEDAQCFVNEVKGIFGVPGCHFLVSVSEDALSSFERRGLPMRDALDSAFDAMVHVDYLRLADSVQLLSRRVMGIPEPFLCLCHCLSGGLPRDLLRAVREMAAISRRRPNGNLGEVCAELVGIELERKFRALRTEISRLDAEPHVSIAMRYSQPDPASPLTTDFVRGLVGRLTTSTAPDEPADLARLRWEAASYAYYCLTLLEVFNDGLDERGMIRGTGADAGPAAFDTLASARQHFALSPRLAWLTTNDFRESWSADLAATPPPGMLVPSPEGAAPETPGNGEARADPRIRRRPVPELP